MSGLKIKLNVNERVLINGALIRNGPNQVCVTVETPGTHILRLKEAIDNTNADTPARQLWLLAQSIVAGFTDRDAGKARFISGLNDLLAEIDTAEAKALGMAALQAAENGNFYLVLRSVRSLSKLIDPPISADMMASTDIQVENLMLMDPPASTGV